MKRKTILISIGGLVVAAGALAMLAGGGDDDLLEVQTAKVSLETIIQTVNATGRIQPKTQIRISADVSAKITTLHVEEGQWVEKGELLVDLDRERYVATVESAQAGVRSAQANAKLILQNRLKAEKDYDRSRDLVARKLESQAVMDTVDAAYQVEVARYESALDQIE